MVLAAAMIQLRDQQRTLRAHRFRQRLQARYYLLAVAQHGSIASAVAGMHTHRLGDDDARAAARDVAIKGNGVRGCDAVLSGVSGRREPHYAVAQFPGANADGLEQAGKICVHFYCGFRVARRSRDIDSTLRSPRVAMKTVLWG